MFKKSLNFGVAMLVTDAVCNFRVLLKKSTPIGEHFVNTHVTAHFLHYFERLKDYSILAKEH